jgi:hypothetical protein
MRSASERKFNVRREGWSWTIVAATFVAPSPEVLFQQLSQRKRVLSVRITEKEYQAGEDYAVKYRKSITKVVRALMRRLLTYKPVPPVKK